MNAVSSKWLTRLTRNAAASINLICFPFGGAAASAYKPLAGCLPANVEVWAVQLPGRENRFAEPFAEHADSVVQAISSEIDRLGLRQLLFFGHSMGSDLAVLSAQWRQQQGSEPLRALVVSGNRPPHILLTQFWADAPHPALVQQLLNFGGIAPEVLANPDFVGIYLEKLRADYRLYEGIGARAAVPLRTPLWVIQADADPLLADVDVTEWRHHAAQPFHLRATKGGHFYFQPDATALATILQEALS